MNINRITTDTEDNIRHDFSPKQYKLSPSIVQIVAIASIAIVGIWILLLLITRISCAIDSAYDCPSFSLALWSLPAIIGIGLVIGLLTTIPLMLQAARNAEYLQVRGVKLHRDDIRQYAPQLITVEAVSARSEATAGLDALTLTNPVNAASVPPVASQQLLEASEINDLVIAPGVWLEWLNRQPHVILAAETGGGKSTAAKAILEPRIKAGEDILIIDPHSSAWFDLPSIGGGENWNEIKEVMEVVSDEYRKRLEERDRYKAETGNELPVSHFKRLTVLLDEANNAQAALNTKKGDNNFWQTFTKTLGSGARKVGISVILLCQSANVEDLGLSGAMRQNFTRIGLDDRVIKQIISTDATARLNR